MTAAFVLARRELLHFLRQPTRLVGSLAQPLLFWLLMGSGFSESFRPSTGDLSYAEFFYPGVVLMLLLFASIFSTITLIEDRTAGFLQGVLVAPVTRLSIVVGKVAGAGAIALIQALVFLVFAPLAGIGLSWVVVVDLIALFALVGLGFAGLGFMVAWTMETVSGYHAVMMVVMMPLWLLSGAVFPLEGAAPWLGWVMRLNPVTYALQVVRSGFYQPPSALATDGDFVVALGVSVAWTALTIAGGVLIATRRPGI